ncbi:hypothetical protein [Ornithinimicrobium murale]|uniref:hypothetical protein n=1 Tax=Ornithinimicrobium murale TaxID=1050153 RepID=UPI000E0CE084|nr:hypothetical protein [Ornithinimicrobium murale]
MKTRAWIGAATVMAVTLVGCSGDDGGDDQPESTQEAAAGQEGAQDPAEGSEPATPAEELRDKLHAADPALCGTTGDESVTHPEDSNPEVSAAWASSCTIMASDLTAVSAGEALGAGDLEYEGKQPFESYATIADAEAGWVVVANDEATDPRAIQEAIGGEISTWMAADAPEDFTLAQLRRIQEGIQPAERCVTDEETDLTELVTREENRSESLDVDTCKLYVLSPALSEEDIEQIKADAVAEAEAGDYGLFWGDYLNADPNIYEKYPWMADTGGRVPGYLLVREDSPQAMASELAVIGEFELLVP